MFNIIGKQLDEFYRLYEAHRMNISATNVYFQNIRLLNTYKTELLSRDDFVEFYKGILNDVKNESAPIDCIIPNDQKLINEDSDDPNAEIEVPEDYKLFIINQEVPAQQNRNTVKSAVDRQAIQGKREDIFRFLNRGRINRLNPGVLYQGIPRDSIIHDDVNPIRRAVFIAVPLCPNQPDVRLDL